MCAGDREPAPRASPGAQGPLLDGRGVRGDARRVRRLPPILLGGTMLVTAVAFSDFVLAIHILAAVVGFGIVFAFPVLLAAAARMDPSVMPWLLRARQQVGRYLVNPGLLVLL